jgi:hypothetical protein
MADLDEPGGDVIVSRTTEFKTVADPHGRLPSILTTAARYSGKSYGDRQRSRYFADVAFVRCLLQRDEWIYFTGSGMDRVRIQDMDRAHARNAYRWLERSAKRVRTLLQDHGPQSALVYEVPARGLVRELPVYAALRDRVRIPPCQAFTRRELKYLAALLSPDSIPESRRDDHADREAEISRKCEEYLGINRTPESTVLSE